MIYTVIISRSAMRELDRLSKSVSGRIAIRINSLAADPRPRGSIKLSGTARMHRIRMGDYRVIYEIDDVRHIVDVLRIRHRSDAYDELP
jgi:mRNA interferase RelE/StbE